MKLEDIRLLYAYDRWANGRLLDAVEQVAAEQFTRDLGASFHSIRDTLLHIIGGEWIWLEYWKRMPVSEEVVSQLLAQRSVELKPELFANAAAVKAKWKEIEGRQIAFVNSLTEERLHQAIEFRGTRVQLWHLMLHLVNHSTYHRGQVTLMMRQLTAEPVATDFHVFVVEQNLVGVTTTEQDSRFSNPG
jgi:uncharacterized damage-inducible protein DinB